MKYIVKTDKMTNGGAAIATFPAGAKSEEGLDLEGKKVFVMGALPQEEVEIEVYKNLSKYAEAKVIRVLQSNPHRIEPQDKEYLETSPWQDCTFDYENQMKRQLTIEAFELSGIENLEIPEFTTDGLEYNYRNKFTYELTEDHNSYAVLERSSHNLLPIEKSSLPREEISERALEILNLGIEDNLDKIVIRVNSNGKTVATGDQDIILSDYLLGQKFVYDLNSFFQINLPVYSLFLRDLQDFVLDLNFKDDLELVDFYSGVGTIGLTLAAGELKDKFKRISLVEVSKSSVKYAKKNCRNILGKYSERAEVVLANANRALGYIKKNSLLIVDPPRAGLDKKVRRQICDVKPKYIAYLSCNPATQARDVRQLLENGYQILQTQGYNFFPRTPHIENLVILEAE